MLAMQWQCLPFSGSACHVVAMLVTIEARLRSPALVNPFHSQQKLHVHHTHAHVVLCRKRNFIELAVRQQGSEAAKRSTEQAAEQAAKEGSAVGLLRVLLKEHDHDNVQMVQLAAKPLLLQDLKVCVHNSHKASMVEAPVVTKP